MPTNTSCYSFSMRSDSMYLQITPDAEQSLDNLRKVTLINYVQSRYRLWAKTARWATLLTVLTRRQNALCNLNYTDTWSFRLKMKSGLRIGLGQTFGVWAITMYRPQCHISTLAGTWAGQWHISRRANPSGRLKSTPTNLYGLRPLPPQCIGSKLSYSQIFDGDTTLLIYQ